MSYVVVQQFTFGTKVAAATVTQVLPLPGATTISAIHRTGSTFLTAGVVPGDGAVIASSGAGNDGTYLIVAIPDEETLIVRATLAAEGATPTVAVLTGGHKLTITDEATTDWSTIVTQVAEPAIIDKELLCNSTYTVFSHCFDEIVFVHTGATATVFTSLEEVAYSRQAAMSATKPWKLKVPIADPGTLTVTLGELANGSVRRSYRKGSVMLSHNFDAPLSAGHVFNAYGSFLASHNAAFAVKLGDGSKFFGTIVNGLLQEAQSSQSGSGVEFQDLIVYSESESAPVIADAVAYGDNVIFGGTLIAGSLFNVGAISIQGLRIGDSLPTVFYNILLNTSLELVDPEPDVDLDARIVTLLGTNEQAFKLYTFNPTIVGDMRVPVQSATVSIYKIDDAAPLGAQTEISGSPFTTDVNGQFGGGDGTTLTIQHKYTPNPATTDNFHHRITIEKEGYTVRDFRFKLTGCFSSQIALQPAEYALEGEEPSL